MEEKEKIEVHENVKDTFFQSLSTADFN